MQKARLFQGSGFDELDAKSWVVDNISGSTFELIGADLSATSGSLDAGNVDCDLYKVTDMARLCIDGINISPGTANTIDISTFCGAASLPGNPTPGSVALTGYSDIDDVGYHSMLDAASDAAARYIVCIPVTAVGANKEYYLLQATFSGKTEEFPVEGAVKYTFNGALGFETKHLFNRT